jgi:hypothetical protein
MKKLLGFSLLLITLLICIPDFLIADPLDNWHLRNPLPQGNDLRGVTYGSGTFVAVGDSGTILTSPDGVTWTIATSGTNSDLSGVTYDNGIFVALGKNKGHPTTGGTILTSPDGLTWTVRVSGTIGLSAVTYGNGTFVTVGTGGTILTSPDGLTWTVRVSGTSVSLFGVTYGNGTFVAVGESALAPHRDGKILTSPDGITWTIRTSGTSYDLSGVTYGNGTFVAVGGYAIVTSPDGVTWTARTSGTNYVSGVAYGNGTFVAVGGGTIFMSPDGVVWTTRTSETVFGLSEVTYGNGTFVAVGLLNIITSSDGVTWTTRISGTNSDLTGVTYGNGIFVAVGMGGLDIVTSPDGVTWTPGSLGPNSGVTYGNGIFVAVGRGTGTILTSPDGVTWITRTSGTNTLSRVTYGDGTFVAVGGGNTVTSPDGATWTTRTSGTNYSLHGIAYGNGTFVAVGGDVSSPSTSGTILTSPDGMAWTIRTSGHTGLSGVVYGDGTFVAVGYNGTIVTSADGVTWAAKTSGTVFDLSEVTYGNGTFVAVGDSGTILTSPDGVAWATRTSETNFDLSGVTYGNGTFVVVGTFGTVLQSDPVAEQGACTYSILPTSNTLGPGPGTGSVNVTANPNCSWTASTNSGSWAWIAITSEKWEGTGNGQINYMVLPNNTGISRSGYLTIAGQTFNITQQPEQGACTYSISPTSNTLGAGAGSGSVNVTAGTDCSWTASTNSGSWAWIAITSGWNGTSSGTVNYMVLPNSTGSSRSGYLTIAGQTFNITQQAQQGACTYSILPTSNTLGPGAGTGSVNVTTNPNCSWTASTNSESWAWIAITSGWNGIGSGAVNYMVLPNNTGISRSGYLTIAGQTFNITQQAQQGACSTVTTNPSGLQVMVDGSTYTAPHTFCWTPGSTHTLSVASPQSGVLGTRYVYSFWSDGGAQKHTITAPSSSTTYTAAFSTQYELTITSSPLGGGTVAPSPTGDQSGIACIALVGVVCAGYYSSSASATLTATPNNGYTFSSWSGNLSGSTNPTSITMNAPKNVTANFVQVFETISTPLIHGPTNGIVNTSYTSYAGAYSNVGHQIEYRFDWGDGTYSDWSSSDSASKSWSSPGIFTIKAQARCGIDTAVVSNWSNGFPVYIQTSGWTPGWTLIDSSIEGRLFDVHFTSSKDGWAVGGDGDGQGLALHYLMGLWEKVDLPNVSLNWSLSGVNFISPDEGWAVGTDSQNNRGVLLHYLKGPWSIVSPPDVNSSNWSLARVYFTSSNEGWAVGSIDNQRGLLLHYLNGEWESLNTPVLDGHWSFSDIYFISSDEGWAIGDRVLFHYLNGSWLYDSSINVTAQLYGVYFTSTSEGWAVGSDNNLFHYLDGSWEILSPNFNLVQKGPNTWKSVHFTSSKDGWAVGSHITAMGPVYAGDIIHYLNGTWVYVPLGVSSAWELNDVYFISPTEGWAVGSKGTGPYLHEILLFKYSAVISISPTSQDFGREGGSGVVNVTADSSWTASTNSGSWAWIAITSGWNGTGSGSVNYMVLPNNTGSSRSGYLTIAGQTFNITQQAQQGACTYSISPTSNTFGPGAGSGSVNVTTSTDCSWAASTNSGSWAWIAITSEKWEGTGSGSVNYMVLPNNTGSSRSGYLTIAGQTFNITQEAQQGACTYSISSASVTLGPGAGEGSVNVTAGANCSWTASTNSGSWDWIAITSGWNGTGSGSVNYMVLPNYTGSLRSGYLTIAGQTFNITQQSQQGACTYSILPTSNTLGSGAGTGTVNVTAGTNCFWTASTNSGSWDWIAITSGWNGTGSGTVNYLVLPNYTGSLRSGYLTIAGQTFAITQAQ